MKASITIIHLVIILLTAFWVQRNYASGNGRLYWSAFLVKAIGSILLGVLYLYYYPLGDTWSNFYEATQLSTLAREDFFTYFQFLINNQSTTTVQHLLYVHDRSLIFIKVISLLCFISYDSYWICALYFSLLSFFTSWFLFLQVKQHIKDSANAAAFALFYFPSIVLWGSGLVKESLALSGLYLLTAVFIKWSFRKKVSWIEWLLVSLSLIVTWSFKYYWLIIFLVVLISSTAVIIFAKRTLLTKGKTIGIWFVFFLVICLIASLAHPNFYLERILQVVVENHDQYVTISKPNAIIHYHDLQPNFWSVLLNSPYAIISGLFRPFIWEATGVFSFLASLENLMLLFLSASFIGFIYKNQDFSRLFPLLIYCITLCIFLALSTPNFGTISRYRVGFLPYFVFVISYGNPWLNYLLKRLTFSVKE